MSSRRAIWLGAVSLVTIAIGALVIASGDASDDAPTEEANAQPTEPQAFRFEQNAPEGRQQLFSTKGLVGTASCGPVLADGRFDLNAWVRSRVRRSSLALVTADPDRRTGSANVAGFGPTWGRYDFLGNLPDGRVGALTFVRPNGVRVVVSFEAGERSTSSCLIEGSVRTLRGPG